jgi:metal-responsive CopG/Arc/MetJ family transcriptional regulator
MKTAISLPDSTFEKVSEQARILGMSRSEFFARAAEHYLEEIEEGAVTRQIDEALDRLAVTDDTASDMVEEGRRFLAETDDEW